MKELGDTLIQLASLGGPVVQSFIWWYYGYWSFVALTISGTIYGVAFLAYTLIRRFQDHEWSQDGGEGGPQA